MNDPNASDDLPFLDELPYTPIPAEEPEQPASPAAPAGGSMPSAAPTVAAPTEPARPPEPAFSTTPASSTGGKRAVIPPAVLARRMQRYSVYLIVLAFLLVGANYDSLSLSGVLWFAAGLTAAFAILCAVAVVLLNAIAWNFDRLREELRGGREAVDLRE